MNLLSTIIYVPLSMAILLFALMNNELVTFNLWPFAFELEVSLSVVVLFFTFVGFLWGRISAWFSYSPTRKSLYLQRKENKKLSKEQKKLNEEVGFLKEDLDSVKNTPEVVQENKKRRFFR